MDVFKGMKHASKRVLIESGAVVNTLPDGILQKAARGQPWFSMGRIIDQYLLPCNHKGLVMDPDKRVPALRQKSARQIKK
jgi:hypothetical protein